MLRFFRENAVTICWVIVVFFALTMFTGGLFLGFSSPGKRAPERAVESNFVTLGKYHVSPRRYNQIIQLSLNRYQDEGIAISPMQVEQIKLMAFNAAVEEQVFFVAAQEKDVQISSVEKQSLEKEFFLENNIKSKRELKKMLKQNDVSYSDFQQELEREIMVRSIKSQIVETVQVDEYLIQDSFKSFQFDGVVVYAEGQDLDHIRSVSDLLTGLLQKGETVKTLQKSYEQVVSMSYFSVDDYRDFLALEPKMRDVFRGADLNVYLSPYCEKESCVITRIKNVKKRSKFNGYKEDEYAKQIKQKLENEQMMMVYQRVLDDHPMMIHSPDLKAIYHKSRQDYELALQSYQDVSSSFPSSPIPHFFRGELFAFLGEEKQAADEFQKADLKIEIAPSLAFSEFYLVYGDFLMIQKKRTQALEKYKK